MLFPSEVLRGFLNLTKVIVQETWLYVTGAIPQIFHGTNIELLHSTLLVYLLIYLSHFDSKP